MFYPLNYRGGLRSKLSQRPFIASLISAPNFDGVPAKARRRLRGRGIDPSLRQLTVRTITERGIPGAFALAEESLAVLFRSKSLRGKIRPTVRTVTERLARGFATGAEVIGLADRKFHTSGLRGCYSGFTHALRAQVSRSWVTVKAKTCISWRGDRGIHEEPRVFRRHDSWKSLVAAKRLTSQPA